MSSDRTHRFTIVNLFDCQGIGFTSSGTLLILFELVVMRVFFACLRFRLAKYLLILKRRLFLKDSTLIIMKTFHSAFVY